MAHKYFFDVKSKATFSSEGPQPQNLYSGGALKIITAGLKAGQKIPLHPEGLIVYTFLEGNGWMIVDGERLAVGPGAIVITLAGSQRGIEAENQLIFVALRMSELLH